jgi:hypothetical protein
MTKMFGPATFFSCQTFAKTGKSPPARHKKLSEKHSSLLTAKSGKCDRKTWRLACPLHLITKKQQQSQKQHYTKRSNNNKTTESKIK